MATPSAVPPNRRRRQATVLGAGLGALALAGIVALSVLSRPVPAPAADATGAPAVTPAASLSPVATAHATLPPAALISDAPASDTQPLPTPSGPTPKPITVPTTRVVTRVVVADLGIDLPVMRQSTPYPACGVAMYILELDQPGAGPTGVTYVYAHAQTGLFLPLLRESLVDDGARMLGMDVDVYTGDSLRFTYRIIEVRRHVTSLDAAFDWSGPESLWLQTSEGQGATVPKLQVIAELVGQGAASDADAHPEPRPVAC